MDPLCDIIALLRPHTALTKPILARGAWGVRYAAYDMPGFALVLDGACWLAVDGAEPARLIRGDFVLLPATPTFAMFSAPGTPCVQGQPSAQAVRYGDPDGPPDFRMLGGSFAIEPANAPLLLSLLPKMIHIHAAAGETLRLSRIIDLINDECDAERPGGGMILDRLLEVMLVEALRCQPINSQYSSAGPSAGLLAGLRDPGLAKALRAMHADVRAGWTVAKLAALAGLSRSIFAARFTKTVGCTPIDYLLRWRMALAKDALSRGDTPLEQLAEQIGYESASAFSTAFRRRVGRPPSEFAKTAGRPRFS